MASDELARHETKEALVDQANRDRERPPSALRSANCACCSGRCAAGRSDRRLPAVEQWRGTNAAPCRAPSARWCSAGAQAAAWLILLDWRHRRGRPSGLDGVESREHGHAAPRALGRKAGRWPARRPGLRGRSVSRGLRAVKHDRSGEHVGPHGFAQQHIEDRDIGVPFDKRRARSELLYGVMDRATRRPAARASHDRRSARCRRRPRWSHGRRDGSRRSNRPAARR